VHDAIVAASRPVYSAVNLGRCKSGAAPSYGFAALHLAPAVKQRSTFHWGDTVQSDPKDPEFKVVVIDSPENAIDQVLGQAGNPFDTLWSDTAITTNGEVPAVGMYLEGHVFGALNLDSTDVDHVSFEIKDLFGTTPGDSLEAAIYALGIDVTWTDGCTKEVRISNAALKNAGNTVRQQYLQLSTSAANGRNNNGFVTTSFNALAQFKQTHNL